MSTLLNRILLLKTYQWDMKSIFETEASSHREDGVNTTEQGAHQNHLPRLWVKR